MAGLRARLSRPQLRLATLFALVTLASVPLAIYAAREHRYRARLAAIATLEKTPHVLVRDAGRRYLDMRLDTLRRNDEVTGVCADSSLSDEQLRALLCFPELRELSLSGCWFPQFWRPRNVAPDQGLLDRQLGRMTRLGSLERLNLAGTTITDLGLRNVASFSTLEGLDLSYTAVRGDGLARLAVLRRLTELHISGTPVTNDGLRGLAALPSLRVLDLSGTSIGDDGARHLGALPSLRVLDLSGTGIGDDGIRHLAALASLRELRLGGTRVSGPGLAWLPAMTRLETLRLEDDDITDRSLRWLLRLPKLRYLNLSGTRISDDGLEALRGCDALQSIELSECAAVSDAGLLHLSRMKSIESVGLQKTSVTAGGVAHLRKLKKDVEYFSVDWDGEADDELGAADGE